LKRFKLFISEKDNMRTLYIHRNLSNPEPFIAWAREAGFKSTLAASDIHCTQAHSSKKVDWDSLGTSRDKISASGGARSVAKLGDAGAVVLKFQNGILTDRFNELIDKGCSWDFPSYIAHISITYDGGDMDISGIEPYKGTLEFGPEIFQEINNDYSPKEKKHE
jgi:hypothetical protein